MSDVQQQHDNRLILKRPRPVISCLACRKKKLKCDRLLPCQQCFKGGRAQSCEYAAGQEPESRESVQDTNNATAQAPSLRFEGSTTGIGPESRQVDVLLGRLKSLEHALHHQRPSSQNGPPSSHRLSSSRSSTMEVDHQDTETDAKEFLPEEGSEIPLLTRFHSAHDFVRSLSGRNQDQSLRKIAVQIHAIKDLTTTNSPVLPTSQTNNQDVVAHMLRLLPEQRICEKLIILYFENFEHCARILHRPTFIEQTNLFGNNQLNDYQRNLYVPMLLGVLSIAASLNTLQECDLPSLHGSVDRIGAVQLMDCWFENIPVREQNSVSGLQVRLLSMQSQKSRHGSSDELWMKSGQVLRQAMLMRLHKKVLPDIGLVDRQVRRWLWLTILEQDLALSIICGMPSSRPPTFVSLPINVNDEDLNQPLTSSIPVYSDNDWTDSICQHVLAHSFNARSRAYGLHFKSKGRVSYSEVMEHAKYLEQILRDLPVPFKLDHNNPPGRLVAQMELDITLRRPLIALYAPFGSLMPQDDIYKEARIAWVQSSLVVLCFQDLFDPKYPVIDVPRPEGYWDLYYTVYKYDVINGLHTELLELQRMKNPRPGSANPTTDLGLQKHAARSHTRALPWTLDGMTKSVEDTLDPLVRRVGRDSADFRDVVLWTIVFDTLCTRDCDDIDAFVQLGLNQLINMLRSRLEREGYDIRTGAENLWRPDGPSSIPNNRNSLQWLSDFLLSSNLNDTDP